MRAIALVIFIAAIFSATSCVKNTNAVAKNTRMKHGNNLVPVNDFTFPADWPLAGFSFPVDAVMIDLPEDEMIGPDKKRRAFAEGDIVNGNDVTGKAEKFAFRSDVKWDDFIDQMQEFLSKRGYKVDTKTDFPDLTPAIGHVDAVAIATYDSPDNHVRLLIHWRCVIENKLDKNDPFYEDVRRQGKQENVIFRGYIITALIDFDHAR